MASNPTYNINTDIQFGPLELIDIPKLVDACTEQWYNQTLCAVNDSVIRLGIIQGEFHWHKHDREDEFFYVVQGRLLIDLEGREVQVTPGQGFLVPREVMHRTRAPERTVIVMVEKSTVTPTGD